jgi:hypothetical protein
VEAVCPKCARRLLIEDARVPAGSFSIRCPQCQATVQLAGRPPAPTGQVEGAAAPPPPPASAPAPAAGAGLPEMTELLQSLVQRKASDLHLCTGTPPTLRVDGQIEALTGRAPLTAAEAERLLA